MHWGIDLYYTPSIHTRLLVYPEGDPQRAREAHFRVKQEAEEVLMILERFRYELHITAAKMVPILRPGDTAGDGDTCPICEEKL